jgi:hypothetical protein
MGWSSVLAISSLVLLLGVYLTREDPDPYLLAPIKIIDNHPAVETYLKKYEKVIGTDYPGYRNHIYRVLTYTLHFLDKDETFLHVIGPALVYHDIGLWTDKQLSYLEPSSARAKEDLKEKFNKDELELIHNIIYWHHKLTPFAGPHEDVVNAARRADWIDASRGLVHQGMPKAHITKVQNSIANNGFHQTLLDFGPRLYGWNVWRIVTELSSILKW